MTDKSCDGLGGYSDLLRALKSVRESIRLQNANAEDAAQYAEVVWNHIHAHLDLDSDERITVVRTRVLANNNKVIVVGTSQGSIGKYLVVGDDDVTRSRATRAHLFPDSITDIVTDGETHLVLTGRNAVYVVPPQGAAMPVSVPTSSTRILKLLMSKVSGKTYIVGDRDIVMSDGRSHHHLNLLVDSVDDDASNSIVDVDLSYTEDDDVLMVARRHSVMQFQMAGTQVQKTSVFYVGKDMDLDTDAQLRHVSSTKDGTAIVVDSKGSFFQHVYNQTYQQWRRLPICKRVRSITAAEVEVVPGKIDHRWLVITQANDLMIGIAGGYRWFSLNHPWSAERMLVADSEDIVSHRSPGWTILSESGQLYVTSHLTSNMDTSATRLDTMLDRIGMSLHEADVALEQLTADVQKNYVRIDMLDSLIDQRIWTMNGGHSFEPKVADLSKVLGGMSILSAAGDGRGKIALGCGAMTLLSSDGGKSYKQMVGAAGFYPEQITHSRDKNGVSCWGMINSGKAYFTTDDGATFTQTPSIANNAITSIATNGLGDWVVTTSYQVLMSNDNAENWHMCYEHSTSNDVIVNAVIDRVGNVTLTKRSADGDHQIHTSYIDGSAICHTSLQTTVIGKIRYSVSNGYFIDAGNVLLHQARLDDEEWVRIPLPFQIQELNVDDTGLLLALDTQNRLWVSYDCGKRWTAIPTPVEASQISRLESIPGGWVIPLADGLMLTSGLLEYVPPKQ